MTEEDDIESGPDAVKASKRNRFKGAIARTKTKLKRHDKNEEQNYKLSDDVNDFLAAGRTSTSSRPSISDTLSYSSDRPPTSNSYSEKSSNSFIQQPSLFSPPNPQFNPAQQSPRKINVPRIDVSKFPTRSDANVVEFGNGTQNNRLLRPEYFERSQSENSYGTKKRIRVRGLSVKFREDPPIIIGEGGDEAQTPPLEISRARARIRSQSDSPMPNWLHSDKGLPGKQISPIKQGLLLDRSAQKPSASTAEGFQPRSIQRIQTGAVPRTDKSKIAFDREFEMSLNLGPGSSPDSPAASAPLHAPKPIRPAVPIPQIAEPEQTHSLKQSVARNDLRMQFEEGQALRRSYLHHGPSNTDLDDEPVRPKDESVGGWI